MTLWEKFWAKPYNPLNAKIGSPLSIDSFGVRGSIFTIHEMWEYKRKVNDKTLTFTDYILRSEDTYLKLRYLPVENPDTVLTHNVLLLSKYDEMAWCESLDEACRCGSGELIINDEDTYWRMNDVKDSYLAKVTVIKDKTEKITVEYWDYHRDTLDEAQQQYTEYLFVELDDDTKMQTMWRGVEIEASSVT